MYERFARSGCCWSVTRFLVDSPSNLTTTRLATSRLGANSPADEPQSPDVRILRSASLYASRPSSSRGSVVKRTGKHRGRFKIRGVAIVIAVDAGTHLQDGDVAPRIRWPRTSNIAHVSPTHCREETCRAFCQTGTSRTLMRLRRISTGDKVIRTLQGEKLSRTSIYVCQAIWYTAASSTMSFS